MIKVKRLKRNIKRLKLSVPLISLFVCNLIVSAEKAFCQINAKSDYASPDNASSDNTGSDNRNITDTHTSGTSSAAQSTELQKFKVMAARNNEINTLLSKAIALYRNKKFAESISIFDQVIRLDPQNAPAHFSLGITLEANDDLAEAASQYNLAHEIDPANSDYQKAILSIKSKIEAQRQSRLKEDEQRLMASQAEVAFKEGQYDQALSLYQSLEKTNPKLAFAKYNIGTIYLILKKPDQAITYYKEAHKLEPSNKQYFESWQKLKFTLKQSAKVSGQSQFTGQSESVKDQQQDIFIRCGLRLGSGKEGVLIQAILTGSRAALAGLLPGDTIRVIDGLSVAKVSQVKKVLGSKPFGQKFQMIIVRPGASGQIQTGQILF